MKVQVNQGRSIQVGSAWYDQRAVVDVDNPKAYGDAVTVLSPVVVSVEKSVETKPKKGA